MNPQKRLGRAEEEDSARTKAVVEERDDPPLQVRLEVDEDVPAEDEVHAGERRIPGQVLLRQDHRLADLLVHPE